MVDLPGPPEGIVASRAPQSSVSRGEIAEPYTEFADTLKTAGTAAEGAAESLAKQAGLRAVTLDPSGNIQVEKAPIVGPASQYYSDAVKMSALAQGEGMVRRKDIELRQKFRDDPQGYLKAADTFADGIQKNWTDQAGPELGLAIRKAIEPITTQTFKGLLNEKERLDLHRAVTAIDSEIDFTKNQMYALARSGGEDSEEFKKLNQKVVTLYNSLVTNPRLAYPQEKVNNELTQFNSELKVQSLARHVVDETYVKEGYDAAQKAAETIRTDRSLNLSPQQRDTAYSRIISELNGRARDDTRILKGTADALKATEGLALKGFTPTPEQMGQLRAQVQATNMPELHAALAQTEAVANTMQQWRQLSPAQLDAALGGLDKTMREKGTTEFGVKLQAAGQELLKNMRTEVGKDPLGWSDRTGTMAVPPIEFGSKDAPGQMTDRASRAETIAAHYGVPPTYLRPDEKHALQVVAARGGDGMLALATTIANGFGDRAPKVMAEISHDAPALAHVGALIQSGGNPVFAADVADAIKLRQDPEAKKNLPNWLAKPSDKMQQVFLDHAKDTYGGAFSLNPDARRAAEGAAKDAFFTRAVRNGYGDLATDETAKKAYNRALQESAGAQFRDGKQYGGVDDYKPGFWTNYKVLIPADVKADRFKDTIGAITADDLAKVGISPMAADGRAYTPSDLRAAVPVAVAGGYRFALGDPAGDDPKFIRGADGKPWVLDFGQMSEKLRTRVPDAFLGGARGAR